MTDSVRVEWAGVEWVLLPGRAVWLPREGALIIADWHLGKGDTLRRAGIALPSGSSIADFARLDGLLARTQARQLVVLGDLLHGRVSTDAAWIAEFTRWRESHSQVALRVARVSRRTELLLRPLHPGLAAMPGLSAVGMLGTGEPVLVLEPDGLEAGLV